MRVIPTSDCSSPSEQTISVADGNKETMRRLSADVNAQIAGSGAPAQADTIAASLYLAKAEAYNPFRNRERLSTGNRRCPGRLVCIS
jgi:hypothetical protein